MKKKIIVLFMSTLAVSSQLQAAESSQECPKNLFAFISRHESSADLETNTGIAIPFVKVTLDKSIPSMEDKETLVFCHYEYSYNGHEVKTFIANGALDCSLDKASVQGRIGSCKI
jgi:hypothetical protein